MYTELAIQRSRMQHYDTVIAELRGRLRVGRKLARVEMNER